jgi:hypothetical protein
MRRCWRGRHRSRVYHYIPCMSTDQPGGGAPESGPPAGPRVALVVTDQPVAIHVAPLKDERTPAGMICLGTSLAGRVVARCVVEPEAARFLGDQAFFTEPVRLALAAQEAPPGLQCRLFAIVTLPESALEEEEEEPEPWAASVPSSDFDRAYRGAAEEEADDEDDTDQQAAILLGHIVRFDRDRLHPGNVGLEAADVLATIVKGKVSEVVDKVLEDLLGADPAA